MVFLSLKKKLQKKKCKVADLKSASYDSQPTFRTVVADSPPSSRTVLETKPELVQPTMYGYEDAAPDIAVNSSTKGLSLDGYGYESHEPTPVARTRRSSMKSGSDPTRAPRRRSSMKGSNPNRAPRRRHSISFQEEAEINEVVPIATMVKNKGDMWMQGPDYYKIVNKVNTIVEQSASGKGQKFCVRGLENMIQKRAGMEDELRNEAWDTVLDEQDIQHATGDYDEEMMSIKYKSCSSRCLKDAKLRALQDEQEVSRYLENTRQYCRRMSM